MNLVRQPVRAGQLAVVCFVLGTLLMVPFEYWWTRLFGMLFLTAAIVLGCIAMLTPRFLAEEPKERELPPTAR